MIVTDPSPEFGSEPVGSTPEQLKAFMQSELNKWTKLVDSLGLAEK